MLWLIEGSVYAVLGAVAGVHLSLLDGLYIMALANLVALVPAAPGYLGTFDAAVLLGVRLVAGGTHAAALAYAVVVRFVLFVPITLVGLVALVVRYGGLRRMSVALRRPAARRAGALAPRAPLELPRPAHGRPGPGGEEGEGRGRAVRAEARVHGRGETRRRWREVVMPGGAATRRAGDTSMDAEIGAARAAALDFGMPSGVGNA